MSGPHPSARMTNQPPPIVSPHRCGAAGRWNSDSTSLSWAQAQSTHHPNAKTNLPSAPVRAACNGWWGSAPTCPPAYTTGEQPWAWRAWSVGTPGANLALAAAATRGNRYINERAKPATGQLLGSGYRRVRTLGPNGALITLGEGSPARPPRGVEASGLVRQSLCQHCGRVSQHISLQSRTGRNPAVYGGIMSMWRSYPVRQYTPLGYANGLFSKYSITNSSHGSADMMTSYGRYVEGHIILVASRT